MNTLPSVLSWGRLSSYQRRRLQPGDIFSIGYDASGGRVVLFRVQAAALPGSGKFQVVGITSKSIKESARMAFDYLRTNGKKVGIGSRFRILRLQHPSHEPDEW